MDTNRDVHASIKIIKDYSYHWHENMTIVMVIAGEINMRVWARDNHMKPGDIQVLNPGQVHRATTITSDNIVVVITFGSEFCTRVCGDFNKTVFLCNSYRYRETSPLKYSNLEGKLKELIFQYSRGAESKGVAEKGEEIVKLLCRDFDYLSWGEGSKKFTDYIISRYRKIYRLIFSDNGEFSDITLKEIAENLGLNYTYLRTDILERFGFSFSWLKYSYMVDMAARTIAESDDRLIDISTRCGFSDQKYMRKYMKIFYDHTPSSFRSSYRKSGGMDEFVEVPLEYIMRFYECFYKLRK